MKRGKLQSSHLFGRTLLSAGFCLLLTIPGAVLADTGSGGSKPAKSTAREVECLADAIYFEARGESLGGQQAVAQVVLNRVRSGSYPTSICGVVYQNQHRRNACQFSFACDGKAEARHETEAWARARLIASEMVDGRKHVASLSGATHYHATSVRPRWAKAMRKLSTIGNHVFYQE